MTWLYIPSNSAPALACLAKDCEPGSDTWASRLAPSVTSSGKHTPPQSWQRACKKAAWMTLLSGPTYAPSMLQHGMAQWIASLRDSRAKTCQSQADVLDSTASDLASSLKSSESQKIAVRDTFFWRTSTASILPPPPLWTRRKENLKSARPPESWENWPTSGGTRSGSLYRRAMWEPATGACAGSAGRGWPTERAEDSEACGNHPGATDSLTGATRTWNTPRANDAEKRGNVAVRANAPELVAQAGHWTTPTATEHQKDRMGDAAMRNEINRENSGMALAKDVRFWTTPDVSSGARDMSKIDPQAQKRADTKRTTGLPTEALNWPTPNVCSPNSMRGNAQDPKKRLEQGHQVNLQDRASYWLTPNVPNGGRSVPEEIVHSKGTTPEGDKRTVGLESQTKFWATPQARDQKSADSADSGNYQRKLEQGYTIDLNSQAHNWPTPATRDYKGANSEEHATVTGGGRKHMDQLSNFVAYSPQAQAIPDGEQSSPQNPGAPQQLIDALTQFLLNFSWDGRSDGPTQKHQLKRSV